MPLHYRVIRIYFPSPGPWRNVCLHVRFSVPLEKAHRLLVSVHPSVRFAQVFLSKATCSGRCYHRSGTRGSRHLRAPERERGQYPAYRLLRLASKQAWSLCLSVSRPSRPCLYCYQTKPLLGRRHPTSTMQCTQACFFFLQTETSFPRPNPQNKRTSYSFVFV